MIPQIKGKEFEALVLFRARELEKLGILTMGRYGVNVVMMNDPVTHKPAWQPIPSLPDFEGILAGSGRQIILEAKVCSQASYPIAATGKKNPKQIDHMLLRSRFGALCFLLIHFNSRQLLRKSDEAATYAIPVRPDDHFWLEYVNCGRRTLNRQEAEMYGVSVPWNQYSARSTKLTPDLTQLLPSTQEQLLIPNQK